MFFGYDFFWEKARNFEPIDHHDTHIAATVNSYRTPTVHDVDCRSLNAIRDGK